MTFCSFCYWMPVECLLHRKMQDVQRLLRSNSVLYCCFVQHRTKFCGSFFQVRVTLVLASTFADQACVLINQPHISNCQSQLIVLEIHDLPKHAGKVLRYLYCAHVQDNKEDTRRTKRRKRQAQRSVLRNWQGFYGSAEWSREEEASAP